MDFIDYIISFIIGSSIVKLYFFFFVGQKQESINDIYLETHISALIDSTADIKDKEAAKQFLFWIHKDEFNTTIYKEPENKNLLEKLEKLRKEIMEFYLKNHCDLSCNVDNQLGRYVIQLMRLRLVIDPVVQISRSVSPKGEKIPYLYVKTNWIDDSGNKERKKFTKLIGQAELYPKGINDPLAKKEGYEKIKQRLIEEYMELYPA